VGCGQTGALFAITFIEAGFKVTLTDADQSLLKRMTKGRATFLDRELEPRLRSHLREGGLNTSSDLKSAVTQSDIIVVTNSAETEEKRTSDLTEAENTCKQIGAAMQRGVLIIYAGAVSFGFTEAVVKEALERTSGLKAGQDFGLAYVHSQKAEQERQSGTISDQEQIVAANDKLSLDAASAVLSTTPRKNLVQTQNFKIAELATLFASARRNVSTALTNELAVFCESAKVDYFETLRIMNRELPESDYAPSINGEEKKRGTHLLLDSAENLGVKLRLPGLATQVNDGMVRHAANLTQNILRECGKTLRRSRIAVLGTAGIGTPGENFVRTLEAKGTRINLYDPRGGKTDPANQTLVPKRSLTEAVENCDCIVIVTAEDQFKRLNLKNIRSIMKTPAAIVDLAGLFEPAKVESEGFIYRGLGRGVDRE